MYLKKTFCSEEERKFLWRAAQTWAAYCVNYLSISYAISLSHKSGVVNTVFRLVSYHSYYYYFLVPTSGSAGSISNHCILLHYVSTRLCDCVVAVFSVVWREKNI